MNALSLLSYAAFLMFLIVGWLLNFFDTVDLLMGGPLSGNEGEAILRVVGLFLAPLGVFLGYFYTSSGTTPARQPDCGWTAYQNSKSTRVSV